jgi:hypothetical protein
MHWPCSTYSKPTPCPVSMAVCICFSALFIKLWQRKILLGTRTGFNCVKLKERDLVVPAVTLFISNLIVFIHWSVISPLRVGIWCWAVLGSINVGALLICLFGAHKARNQTVQFSSAKWIGIELSSLLLLLLIGSPMMLPIDKDEVSGVYKHFNSDPYFVAAELGFLLRVSLFIYIYVHFYPSMEEQGAGIRRISSCQIDIAILV